MPTIWRCLVAASASGSGAPSAPAQQHPLDPQHCHSPGPPSYGPVGDATVGRIAPCRTERSGRCQDPLPRLTRGLAVAGRPMVVPPERAEVGWRSPPHANGPARPRGGCAGGGIVRAVSVILLPRGLSRTFVSSVAQFTAQAVPAAITEVAYGPNAHWLEEPRRPRGGRVVLDAEHTCMTLRGIQAPDSRLVTSALHGVLCETTRQHAPRPSP